MSLRERNDMSRLITFVLSLLITLTFEMTDTFVPPAEAALYTETADSELPDDKALLGEGSLCDPEKLEGVWLQVNRRVDGQEETCLPENFNSLIFRMDGQGDAKALRVSSESGDYSGFAAGGRYYEREITILDQPIYPGCGNEVWSARIGDASPLNAYGNPQEMETYVTLLDQNTLLQQCYFSYDEGDTAGISYQTYKRFLPVASYDLEKADLEGCCFELVGYSTDDGQNLPTPPGMSNFHLCMNTYGYDFTVTFDDKSDYQGTGYYWGLGEGGTLLMCNAQSLGDCYAGAAQSSDGIVQMYLWYEGGIMWLKQIEENMG